MYDIKVGDYVEVVCCKHNDPYQHNVGVIGLVIKLFDGLAEVESVVRHQWAGLTACMPLASLRKASWDEAKVGDYIEVTSSFGNSKYFRVGAGGKVVSKWGDAVAVRFTYGDYDANPGQWAVSRGRYKVIKPYSSLFVGDGCRGDMPSTDVVGGHVADGGGLQKHSVGDVYPLCVVGYSRDANYTMYVVEDLERGTVACDRFGTPLQWRDSRAASNFARTVDRTATGAPPWFKGRPNFELQLNLTLKREG